MRPLPDTYFEAAVRSSRIVLIRRYNFRARSMSTTTMTMTMTMTRTLLSYFKRINAMTFANGISFYLSFFISNRIYKRRKLCYIFTIWFFVRVLRPHRSTTPSMRCTTAVMSNTQLTSLSALTVVCRYRCNAIINDWYRKYRIQIKIMFIFESSTSNWK